MSVAAAISGLAPTGITQPQAQFHPVRLLERFGRRQP
jgi:hypothetical protein